MFKSETCDVLDTANYFWLGDRSLQCTKIKRPPTDTWRRGHDHWTARVRGGLRAGGGFFLPSSHPLRRRERERETKRERPFNNKQYSKRSACHGSVKVQGAGLGPADGLLEV